jgi:hypothetical protein
MIPIAKCVSCLELPVGGLSGGNPGPSSRVVLFYQLPFMSFLYLIFSKWLS